MAYKTLMVHLNLGRTNADLLQVTSELANRLEAKVIGLSLFQYIQMIYTDGFTPVTYPMEDTEILNHKTKAAEAEFNEAFRATPFGTEWRAATIYEAVADYVSSECCNADLLITSGYSVDPHNNAAADIVMQAGRPVLIVPMGITALKLNHVVIASRNTREARRAIADALPMLKVAKRVTVLEIAYSDERARVTDHLDEIISWLRTHDVDAEAKFVASDGGGDAFLLNSVVKEIGADLVVAGAYGHSRVREWAFGGMTHDLLRATDYCTLLSH
jgi:nucleotide-binding universal stress UspA family protein